MALALAFGEADARPMEHGGWGGSGLDAEWRIGGEEIDPVGFGADRVGGADFGGSAEKIFGARHFGSPVLHRVESIEGFGGADEHGGADSGGLGGDVEHPVHAVGEVDVGVARFAEHDLVSGRGAAVGVAAGIVEPAIGFRLHDSGAELSLDQISAEQGGGTEPHVLAESGKEGCGGHAPFCRAREKTGCGLGKRLL